MKKLLAFTLAALLLLSFAGCSKNTPSDTTLDHTHNHPHTQAADTQSTSSFPHEAEEVPNTKASTPQPTDVTVQSAAHTDPEVVVVSDTLERGVTRGNLYTSATLGLTFEKPSAWAFATEGDLAYYSGLLSGGFGDFAATAQEIPAVYDMYASNKETGGTVSICYENLLITVGEPLSAKEYADIIKNAISENPDSTVTEEGEITLGARTYSKLVIKSAQGSSDAKVKTYYLTQVGNYMATIIVTLPEGADLEADNMFR